MKSVSSLLAAVLLSGVSGAATAADLAGEVPPSAQDGWIATVGAKITVDPEYPGSGDYSVFGLPSLGLRRASDPEPYAALDDSFSFGISISRWLRVGIAGDYLDDRNKDDDSRLKGLRPIDWTAEAGGFVEVWPVEWLRGRVELLKTFNGVDGFVANVAVDAIVPVTERISIAFGPRLSVVDDAYMRTYFGVTPAEAAKSKVIHRTFRPDGGIESAGAAAAVSYQFDDNWRATLGGGWDRLVGDAADSPITRRIGSEDQFWGGLRIAYSFGIKGF